MAKAYFMVRAVVEEPLRQKFDHWYSTHHLPMALKDFKAEQAWRYWSTLDAGVHYAIYQFRRSGEARCGDEGRSAQAADRRLRQGLANRRRAESRQARAGGGAKCVLIRGAVS
jgi:hypothetical protein